MLTGNRSVRRSATSAPPSYVVSGGAGAPLAKGGFYNYLVFTVDGSQVSFTMVKPGGAASPAR